MIAAILITQTTVWIILLLLKLMRIIKEKLAKRK